MCGSNICVAIKRGNQSKKIYIKKKIARTLPTAVCEMQFHLLHKVFCSGLSSAMKYGTVTFLEDTV